MCSNDLQIGFKKHLGCGPALNTLQEVVKYFTSRGSTLYIASIDASKAFDRVDHNVLIAKLNSRKLPACFINVISCWYDKLYSSVRWNSMFSDEFKVNTGVRQGGILSPILFNVYMDDLIDNLKQNGFGCHIGNVFAGCIMYADDLLILSPSVGALQNMLDTCSTYGLNHNIMFNAAKTVCVAVGYMRSVYRTCMIINSQPIPWMEQFKYLGVLFTAK